MKTRTFILILTLLVGAILGSQVYKYFFTEAKKTEGKIVLEEILSIKELHLVRHTYRDLFFLHRGNDDHKAIRAIVEVPVTVTSFINLKDIQIIRVNDTIRSVILPHAQMNPPSYDFDKMVIRKTRAFQLHAGKDLYPEVSRVLQSTITSRMDSIRAIATTNKILDQAEAEGKEYIETVLKAIGRSDVNVTFAEAKNELLKPRTASNALSAKKPSHRQVSQK